MQIKKKPYSFEFFDLNISEKFLNSLACNFGLVCQIGSQIGWWGSEIFIFSNSWKSRSWGYCGLQRGHSGNVLSLPLQERVEGWEDELRLRGAWRSIEDWVLLPCVIYTPPLITSLLRSEWSEGCNFTFPTSPTPPTLFSKYKVSLATIDKYAPGYSKLGGGWGESGMGYSQSNRFRLRSL